MKQNFRQMVFLVLKSRIAIWYKINEEKPQTPTQKTFIVLELPTLPESEALGPSLILFVSCLTFDCEATGTTTPCGPYIPTSFKLWCTCNMSYLKTLKWFYLKMLMNTAAKKTCSLVHHEHTGYPSPVRVLARIQSGDFILENAAHEMKEPVSILLLKYLTCMLHSILTLPICIPTFQTSLLKLQSLNSVRYTTMFYFTEKLTKF